MKKRIIILLIIALFTTGCTCEYNLKLENGKYHEEIVLTGENSEEINQLNTKLTIPVDKDIYNHPGDYDSKPETNTETYKNKYSGNKLTLTYDFSSDNYYKSSAVSNCYNTLSVSNYNDSTIISTSSNEFCFSRYPTLNNIRVNITIDGVIISHNADSVSGNTYTWNLTRDDTSDKSINIIFKEKQTGNDIIENNDNKNQDEKEKKDYTMYIFAAVILTLLLIGYTIYLKIKKEENNMDV